MSRDLPRWLTFGDPSVICERVEEMEQAKAKRDDRLRCGKGKFALEQLREVFEESKVENGGAGEQEQH